MFKKVYIWLTSSFFGILFYMSPVSLFLNKENLDRSYVSNEFLKYRVRYGFINAGYATLLLSDTLYNNQPHYKAEGKGWSSQAISVFFKVKDLYQTYIDKATQKPSFYRRKIYEGGYTKDIEQTYNHKTNAVFVSDRKNNTKKYFGITDQTQDLLSGFYYLRNLDTSGMNEGDALEMDIFIDDESYRFKMVILARETIKTRFGPVKCLKIRPYVMSGRIFKEKEGVVMWVSDNKHHVPVLLKAALLVGNLRAELIDYKNVSISTP